jgi:predicted ArsR family transcriptional regulator
MTPKDVERQEIDHFIMEEVESVPHLEALLLLFNSRPKQWALQQMADSLYISSNQTQSILQDLVRRNFVAQQAGVYVYNEANSRNALIGKVDQMYRQEVVRISTMIHSRASSSVREFARAFKFTKD